MLDNKIFNLMYKIKFLLDNKLFQFYVFERNVIERTIGYKTKNV